jgi:hypothetical protein
VENTQSRGRDVRIWRTSEHAAEAWGQRDDALRGAGAGSPPATSKRRTTRRAHPRPGTTAIKGSFNSNPEGTDEGKTLLGSESVSTNGTGNASIALSTKKVIRLGQNITATATSASTGDTSEFSAPRKAVSA